MKPSWRGLALLATLSACAPGDEKGGDTPRSDSVPATAAPTPDTGPLVTPAPEPPPSESTPPAPKSGQPRPGAPAPAPTPAPQAPRELADTVRGVVRVVGSMPVNVSVVLAPAGSNERVRVTGPAATTLRGLGGVEVVARGARAPSGELAVEAFTVRSVNGEPAVDGVIVADGSGLAIDTEDGRRRLGNPPDALRELVGARVWISGALDRGPNLFGVISR